MGKNALISEREVRAQISKEFRAEIQQHGLANAILSVVGSTSEKVPVKRNVLMQQCRKADFNARFQETCSRLVTAHPTLAMQIIELKQDVCSK